jgi:hypothetical protein
MAIDQEFRPEAPETDRLLRLSGADPAFVQLCRAQKCFRARLTSKPWRCRYRLLAGAIPAREPERTPALRAVAQRVRCLTHPRS